MTLDAQQLVVLIEVCSVKEESILNFIIIWKNQPCKIF